MLKVRREDGGLLCQIGEIRNCSTHCCQCCIEVRSGDEVVDSAGCPQCRGHLAQKIRGESSPNAKKWWSVGFTPQKTEPSSHQMAVLSGGHPQSPSGRGQITSHILRYWSLVMCLASGSHGPLGTLRPGAHLPWASLGPSGAQGIRSPGPVWFWFPGPFPVWLPVHPFRLWYLCVRGQQPKSRTVPCWLVHVCLEGTGEVEVTGITFPPLTLTC